MKCIKKGDIVGRKSYGKDIIFKVSNIIEKKDKKIAILNGVIERIEADSEISDLELIEKQKVTEIFKKLDNRVEKRIANSKNQIEDRNYQIGLLTNDTRAKEKIISGKILHLDGECIILEKIEENAYQAYPIADLSILKLSCINGKNLHFYKKHDNIITKNI